MTLHVKEVLIKKFRIVCYVEVSPDWRFSNPDIKNYLLKRMPTLAYHECKNRAGESFLEQMSKTSIPHLLEHMIVDLQVKHQYDNNINTKISLIGTSKWTNSDKTLAQIELTYYDDCVAIDCIGQAVEILNKAIENSY